MAEEDTPDLPWHTPWQSTVYWETPAGQVIRMKVVCFTESNDPKDAETVACTHFYAAVQQLGLDKWEEEE